MSDHDPDITSLRRLYKSLDSVGATRQERQALARTIEELSDSQEAAYSRSTHRQDVAYLKALLAKTHSSMPEYADALEDAVMYAARIGRV